MMEYAFAKLNLRDLPNDRQVHDHRESKTVKRTCEIHTSKREPYVNAYSSSLLLIHHQLLAYTQCTRLFN